METVAEPNENVIDAKLSVCVHCGQPIATMMGSPWTHANSGADKCTDDPRLDPPK